LAEPGTTEYIELAILLALMTGVIQFVFGLLRLGFMVNFLSYPVVTGFNAASAVIIAFSQLKHLLGIDLERSHHIHKILLQAIQQFEQVNFVALSIGLAGIAMIFLFKRVNKRHQIHIPGALVALALSILVVWIFNLQSTGLNIVQSVPSGLPNFSVPNTSKT